MQLIFDQWFLPLSAVLGFIVIVTNLFSFLRAIKVSETLERSLMVLIYIDPLTSIVCSLVFVVTVCLRYFSVVITEVCDLVYLSLHTPSLVGVVATAAVAVVRFVTVNRCAGLKVTDARLFKFNVALFSLVFMSIFGNVLIHKHLGHPLSILSETCFSGDEGREVYWPARAWSIGSLVFFQVVSITFDVFILKFISQHTKPAAVNGSRSQPTESPNLQKFQDILFNTTSYMAIPSRATLLSSLLLLPYLILVPIKYHIFSSNVYKISIIETLMLQVLGAIRFPITLHATFIELATIKNRGRLRKRMERQRLEEEDALKNRMERQKMKASQSMEVDI